MSDLGDMWYEACLEIWEMGNDRPYLKDEATIWNAFEYAYMKMVGNGGVRQCG